jgi:hypothetical protein
MTNTICEFTKKENKISRKLIKDEGPFPRTRHLAVCKHEFHIAAYTAPVVWWLAHYTKWYSSKGNILCLTSHYAMNKHGSGVLAPPIITSALQDGES